MATVTPLWQQIIFRLLARRPGAIGPVAALLWQQLARHLGAIIGDAGFWSLYARNLHLCSAELPWLAEAQAAPGLPLPQALHFEALAQALAAQQPDLARQGAVLLLVRYLDLLASLIGEQLTIQILHAAWGDDVMDLTVKEPSE